MPNGSMGYDVIGTIIGGVVVSNLLIRIIWSYLESRKHNPNGHFDLIVERLQRILDKLEDIHTDIRKLERR